MTPVLYECNYQSILLFQFWLTWHLLVKQATGINICCHSNTIMWDFITRYQWQFSHLYRYYNRYYIRRQFYNWTLYRCSTFVLHFCTYFPMKGILLQGYVQYLYKKLGLSADPQVVTGVHMDTWGLFSYIVTGNGSLKFNKCQYFRKMKLLPLPR